MSFIRRVRTAERGSVLIQVAIALLAMTAFSALVIDYGFMWVARGQTQNAADMAAHAGAVSLMFDYDPTDATTIAASEARAAAAATAVATKNSVVGEAPSGSTVDVSMTDCVGDGFNDCVDVKVYRNAEKSNRLPVFFGNLLSGVGLGAKARAVSRLEVGVGSDCLAPFAVPDKWTERQKRDKKDDKKSQWKFKDVKDAKWDKKATFEKYCENPDSYACLPQGSPQVAYHDLFADADQDTYTSPGSSGSGTGYKFQNPNSDYGAKLDLDDASTDPQLAGADPATASLYVPIDFSGTGDTTVYSNAIGTCSGMMVLLGDTVAAFNPWKSLAAATDTAIDALVASDSKAKWDNKKVRPGITGSCAQASSPCATAKNGLSPRVLQLPLYDPTIFEDCRLGKGACAGSPQVRLKITNIVGCFAEGSKKAGGVKCTLMPFEAVTCSQAKKKGKVTCPPTSFDSFLRSVGMYQ